MKKLIAASVLLFSFSSQAQTLFTYGKQPVTVKEFLRAYQKNKTGPTDEKGFREYFNLYVNSRLKIHEARQEKLDTIPQLVSDLQTLRLQILPGYLNDKASVQKLVDEAFTRAQKDIHLQHIFISFKQGTDADIADAKKKAALAEAEIKNGTAFSDVANKYSDDPNVKDNAGDIGWITVFNLPYQLENVAYATPTGKVSGVFESRAGLHIFKNMAERKDPGKINAAEILLAFPPNANAEDKTRQEQLADSLYKRLQAHEDFSKLATQFSLDQLSASSNGQMSEFGVGDYEPSFEQLVYSMKDGEISKPFLSSHGYHIVKRISLTPVTTNKGDEKYIAALKDKVTNNDRILTIKETLAKKLRSTIPIKEQGIALGEIAAYTDSILEYKKPNIPVQIKPGTTVLEVSGKKLSASDWIAYAQPNRVNTNGGPAKSIGVLWDQFKTAKVVEYYEDHLEKYNEDFRNQINEFAEGNLFFEVMQQNVWTPAQSDSVALAKYYQLHKTNYKWNKSADAIVFFTPDEETSREFSSKLNAAPAKWRELLKQYDQRVTSDSARYDLAQLPADVKGAKQDAITPIQVNKTDNTTSFAYIVKLYPGGEPMSYAEAKGLVINDYQSELEKKWIEKLRKKYPVVVNEKALNDIIKNKKY
jgi:peptidyl-prolyl cis-trans isomerase SurA